MNDNISVPLIGNQIRAIRKARGLSLQALAKRCGTSAPTLHRYETGWDRFEIATLRRIAAALGARLEISLRMQDQETSIPDKRKLRNLIAPLFWDRKLTVADLNEHPGWVLGRVLMYGNVDQVHAARAWYGDAAIAAAVAQRGIDERTRNYWKTILDGSHASQGT